MAAAAVAGQVRKLTRAQVHTLVAWAAREGWNPGLADADVFYSADPDGFLGFFVPAPADAHAATHGGSQRDAGATDEGSIVQKSAQLQDERNSAHADEQLVAGIAAIRYGPTYSFAGLYICDPAYRRRDCGRVLGIAAEQSLEGRIIAIDAVAAMRPSYARIGFVTSHETARWSGNVQLPTEDAQQGQSAAGLKVVPITDELYPQIDAYDRLHFPGERSTFLCAWLQAPHVGLALVEEGDAPKIHGYCVLRICDQGAKIGPVFADDLPAAKQLIRASVAAYGDAAAAAGRPGEEPLLHIDVPEAQKEFSAWLSACGMTSGFTTTRMHKNGTPAVARPQGVFAFTTLELG